MMLYHNKGFRINLEDNIELELFSESQSRFIAIVGKESEESFMKNFKFKKKIGKVINTDFIVFYNKDESDFFLIGKSHASEYYNSFETYID